MEVIGGFMIVTYGARILIKGKIFSTRQAKGMSALC